MSDSATETSQFAPPVVTNAAAQEIALGVYVIPDERVPLVPNVGIVVGDRRALVVDTAMGPANGRRVLEKVRAVTDRPLLLTITHFHPEHGFGAQVFEEEATILYNRAQLEELLEKGPGYLELFRSFGPAVANELEDVEIVRPHIAYDERAELDLGGVTVQLSFHGRAHTRGDQVVFVPERRVLFTGDLAENRIFPIFPWFPPNDADVTADGWIQLLERLEAMQPDRVVPGHGEVGGVEVLQNVRGYLIDVRGRVARVSEGGKTAEDVKAELEPLIRSDYPGWDAPEWIGFAIDGMLAELDG